jgi:hypothetical protein
MSKKLFLLFCFISLTTLSFAHSGRLDGQGGHRVNKEWFYDGQYIEIENNIPHLEKGSLLFKQGDYHYHCKPSANKIDLNTYRDGIYLPMPVKEIKNTITSNIKISEENRVASKESNIYHKPDCQYIENIKKENIIIFEDKEDAEKNDYISCKICKPEVIE